MTDSRGHRVGSLPAPSDGWRVLALGDSFLEALQVEHESSFAHLLSRSPQDLLDLPGTVVNTGVAACNPNHYLLEGRQEIRATRVDVVLVCVFLGTDQISERVERFAPREPVRRHRLQWPGSLTYSDWHESVLQPFDDVLTTRSHLYVLLKRSGPALGRLGLTRVYFPASVYRTPDPPRDWATTVEVLSEIAEVASRAGAPTILVLLPGVYQVDPTVRGWVNDRLAGRIDLDQPAQVLAALLRDRTLTVVDTMPVLRAAMSRDVRAYGSRNPHLSPAGHRIVASTVAPILERALRKSLDAPGRSVVASTLPE